MLTADHGVVISACSRAPAFKIAVCASRQMTLVPCVSDDTSRACRMIECLSRRRASAGSTRRRGMVSAAGRGEVSRALTSPVAKVGETKDAGCGRLVCGWHAWRATSRRCDGRRHRRVVQGLHAVAGGVGPPPHGRRGQFWSGWGFRPAGRGLRVLPRTRTVVLARMGVSSGPLLRTTKIIYGAPSLGRGARPTGSVGARPTRVRGERAQVDNAPRDRGRSI
jgi:hypothetical protein